jgi:hypothetical protein
MPARRTAAAVVAALPATAAFPKALAHNDAALASRRPQRDPQPGADVVGISVSLVVAPIVARGVDRWRDELHAPTNRTSEATYAIRLMPIRRCLGCPSSTSAQIARPQARVERARSSVLS